LKSLKSENRNPEQKEDETEQKRITPGSSDNAIKNRNATEITVNPKGPFKHTLRCALLRAAARCCAGKNVSGVFTTAAQQRAGHV